MSFNYGYERKKFEAEWRKLRKEYEKAGMSREAIDAMYRFDLDIFNGERAYYKHTQSMKGFSEVEEKSAEGDDVSPMQKRFLEAMSADALITDPDRRYGWIDEMDDEEMVKIVLALSPKDRLIITKVVYEGFSQVEVAEAFGVTKQYVNNRLMLLKKRIKKIHKAG